LARDTEDTVSVFTAKDIVEAQMIQGVLEESGIKVLMHPYQDDNFPFSGGPFAAGTWGEINVLEADEEKALEIIEDYLKKLK